MTSKHSTEESQAAQDLNIKWIGDLSLQDANLLRRYVQETNGNVLEFGVGGSTHIIAQSLNANRKFISIDTSPEWIELTHGVLKKLNRDNCLFVAWQQWVNRAGLNNLEIDLIFNDGHFDLREQFGIDNWHLLIPGGFMLFHDTRHISIIKYITRLIEAFHNEIEEIRFNERWQGVSSNLTAIRKKAPEPYVNWSYVENKPSWRYGYPNAGPAPADYWSDHQKI